MLTASTAVEDALRLDNSVNLTTQVVMEWNYNSFQPITQYGCYLTPTRTNLALNSSFMHNSSGVPTSWAGMFHPNSTGSTLTVNTTTSQSGSNSGAIYRGTYSAPNNNYAFMNQTVSLVAGRTYTLSAYVYSTVSAPIGSDGAWIVFRNESAAYNATGFALVANTWTRISKTFVPTTTASTHVISIGYEGAGTAGRTLLVDSVLLEEAPTAGTYFDGTTTNGSWEGTAHNSKAILNTGIYNPVYSSNSSYYDDGLSKTVFDGGDSGLIINDDLDRKTYTPIQDIFKPNRPDPGIVHLTSYRKGSQVIPIENLKIGNFGNIYGGARADRVYPIYKNSKFRYWNSVRNKVISNVMTTVGYSNASKEISYAAPFAIYESSFRCNKIVIKTQKYAGYPYDFKVEYLDASNNWIVAYTGTSSTEMTDGILEIFYNPSTPGWDTSEHLATQFTGTPTDSIVIKGIRFSVTKMSEARVPLEVIEISPRLVCDVTDYVLTFDKDSSIGTTGYGIPVAGIVSGTGTLNISNVDRIFSSRNSNSILSNMLVKGTEVRAYQKVNGLDTIPLGTFYALNWQENTDFTTTINLDDYFLFLKSTKAPDISIANLQGIETSVAILMLLDNVGITNYNFVKQSSTSKDDYIIEYFFSDKDKTVAEVLEQIALSSQCAVYMDVNNNITVMTKEKMMETVSPGDTDYWAVGSEDWAGKTEETYLVDQSTLANKYIANIQNISEVKVTPLTDLVISYKGNGIQKAPMAVKKHPEIFEPQNVAYYNSSIVARDLSYVNSLLWSVEGMDNGSDKVLLSMPYIVDISASRPSQISTISVGNTAKNNDLKAASENDLIRTIYANATAEEKKYFEIVLDQERGVEFLQAKKFSGYVVIDSELIKYKGMVVDVFDEKSPTNSKRSQVVFDGSDVSVLINLASSGSSVVAYSILVDLNYVVVDRVAAIDGNLKQYRFVSDGRGQENTNISSHKSQATSDFLSNPFKVKLYDTTVSTSIKPTGTLSSKSVNLLNPLNPQSKEKSVSYPGYFKLSGPKSVSSATKKPELPSLSSDHRKTILPIDNFGERFITGFYKTLTFKPQKISTRLRLLEKPSKTIFEGEIGKPKNYGPENRGIAGLAFRLATTSNGTTGYFVEIEDIANITAEQLEKQKYSNLRLYKVYLSGSTYYTKVLSSAWVNVSAVAGESIDFGQAMINNGRSYAGTSDLSVVISEAGLYTEYSVFWEGQKVTSYKELTTRAINKTSKVIGMFSRSDSEAMFDYILSSSTSKNPKYKVNTVFSPTSELMTISEIAERGLMPSEVISSATSNGNVITDMEDFGRQLREAKKFDVTFENPSVSAKMISLAKTNKDYAISNFSFSSYGATFWAFNTSRASITLGPEQNTPIMISGVQISEISPGEISLASYVKNIAGEENSTITELELNENKFGTNSLTFDATYINSKDQAESLLKWVYEHMNKEKREFSIDMFANPLIEIGDKVRLYYSDIEHEMANIVDAVYYVTAIRYSVAGTGPTMSITIREI